MIALMWCEVQLMPLKTKSSKPFCHWLILGTRFFDSIYYLIIICIEMLLKMSFGLEQQYT